MRAGLWTAFVERFTSAGILFEQVCVLILSLWLVFAHEMTIGTMAALQLLAAVLGNSLLNLVEFLQRYWCAGGISGIKESLQESSEVMDKPDARTLLR